MTKLITQCPTCQTTFHTDTSAMDAHNALVTCGICYQGFNALDHQKPSTDEPLHLTQCHQCHCVFRVTAEQRQHADGWVRCGQCGELFDGEQPATTPRNTKNKKPKPYTALHLDDPDAAYDLRPTVRHRSFKSIIWALSCLILSMALFTQYTYLMRNELAQHEQLRPWLEKFCQTTQPFLPCTLALRHDPEQFQIMKRTIEAHNQYDNALSILIQIGHRGNVLLAAPDIQLSFLDINNQLLAQRRFSPDEYYLDKTMVKQGIDIDQTIIATLEIEDPDKKAINFEINFF